MSAHHFSHVYRLEYPMIVKLKNVRLAFCQNLWTAGTMGGDPNSKPSFGCTLLIPKTDPQCAEIKKFIEQVATEKWAAKAPSILKSLVAENKVCLRDGDNKEQYDGFKNCMYIGARSNTAPMILDRSKAPLQEKDGKPYAGCFVNASIDIWPQDNNFGKRINAKLRWVQYFGDGDAFSGSAPASPDEVDDLSDTGEPASPSAGNPWD